MERINVKKTWSGWKSSDGDDYTHVIISKDELEDLEHEIVKLKIALDSKDLQISRIQQQANKNVQDYQAAADEKVAATTSTAEKAVAAAENRAADLENKNKNLIRIAKERANADRKLTPKKQRSGYLLQSMDQTKKVFFQKKERITQPCWKCRLQTPYTAQLDFKTVRESVTNDILTQLAEPLGIKSVYRSLDNDSPEQLTKLWNGENFIFDLSYKLNATKGYWEVEFLSRASLIVTDDILNIKSPSS